MAGRFAALAALVTMAACANVESVGRNSRAEAPTPAAPASRPAPQPAPAVTLPPPQATASAPNAGPTRAPLASPPPTVSSPAPQVAAAPTPRVTAPTSPPRAEPPTIAAPPVASQVSVPTPAPPPSRPRSDDEDIIVPGQAQEQVIAPEGDFRSRVERTEDIRAWDQCVTSVQAVYERDPMRPALTSPEDYCSRSLGMSSRDAIPDSRVDRQLRRRR